MLSVFHNGKTLLQCKVSRIFKKTLISKAYFVFTVLASNSVSNYPGNFRFSLVILDLDELANLTQVWHKI